MEKHIFVRYTVDEWRTFHDVDAQYVANGDRSLDRFIASVPLNTTCSVRMQFVVCYQVNGCEYWDNNGGRNYQAEIEDIDKTPCSSPRLPRQQRRVSILKTSPSASNIA